MAKRISDLTEATQLGDNDSFVFNDVDAGVDKRVTASGLKTALDLATKGYVDDKASLSSVASIADLKNLNTNPLKNGDVVFVRGGATVEDGGQGNFRWDSTSEETDDGGIIIQVTGVTEGRFKRILDGFVTPEMFVTNADGETDNSGAIKKALNYSSTTGMKFQGVPNSLYTVQNVIVITRTPDSPRLIIDWNGSTVHVENTKIDIAVDTELIVETTFSSYPSKGDSVLELTDTTGMQKGDRIHIVSPVLVEPRNVNVMHYYLVEEVDGNNVYIEGTVVCDMNATQITDDGFTGDFSITVERLPNYCEMRNGNFIATDTPGTNTTTWIRDHYRVCVENMEYSGHTRGQLNISGNGHTNVRNIKFHDFGYVEKDSGYISLASAPSGDSFGYGLIHSRNCFSTVRDVTGGRGWHVIDVARGQMHVWYYNVIALRNSFGFSQHVGCWETNYINCNLYGNNGMLLTEAIYVRVKDCNLNDIDRHALQYSGLSTEVNISGCKITQSSNNTGDGRAVQEVNTRNYSSHKSANTTVSLTATNNEIIWDNFLHFNLHQAEKITVKNNVFKRTYNVGVVSTITATIVVEGNEFIEAKKTGNFSGELLSVNPETGGEAYIVNNRFIHESPSSFQRAILCANGNLFIRDNVTNCLELIYNDTANTPVIEVCSNNTVWGGDICTDVDIAIKNSLYNHSTGSTNTGGATVTNEIGHVQLST